MALSIRSLLDLFSSRVFLRELTRTLLAWAALFAVGIWMVVCQQWSDMRWLRRFHESEKLLHQDTTKHPSKPRLSTPWPAYSMLEDQILDHLPVMERAWISDKLVGSSVIICMVGGCILARGWRQRLMLLRRIAWMVTALYFLRSITISVTTVPPSIGTCEIAVPQSTWEVILATPDILAGKIGQCTDKIFSGHTAILMISFLFWLRYATHWAIIAYSAVHTFVGVLTVLLARYHYTVDVVLGAVLTYLVHRVYYSALELAIARRRESKAAYAKSCMSGSMDEDIDEDEDGELPRVSEYTRVRRRRYVDDNDGLGLAAESWRDYDSAVGVDVGDIPMTQYNQQQQPPPAQSVIGSAMASAAQTPCGDDRGMVFGFRKRETSSTTAVSRTDESMDEGEDMQEQQQLHSATVPPARHGFPTSNNSSTSSSSSRGSSTPHHHEVTIHDHSHALPTLAATVAPQQQTPAQDQQQHPMMPVSHGRSDSDDRTYFLPRRSAPSATLRGARGGSRDDIRLELLGINRPFGSLLPTLVSWMDGLDIRDP